MPFYLNLLTFSFPFYLAFVRFYFWKQFSLIIAIKFLIDFEIFAKCVKLMAFHLLFFCSYFYCVFTMSLHIPTNNQGYDYAMFSFSYCCHCYCFCQYYCYCYYYCCDYIIAAILFSYKFCTFFVHYQLICKILIANYRQNKQ